MLVLSRSMVVLFLLGALAASGAAWADIRQTGSGICHPPHSPYYERLKSFDVHATIEACLASDGRLPKGLTLLSDADTDSDIDNSVYQRSAFGHGWDDEDGNGWDTRAEVLIAQSLVPVRFATDRQRRVTHGRWVSPWTGQAITDASSLDADHVVPLAFAWKHGADQWTNEDRLRFANDPRNVVIVEASLNRSKGARDILEWLPPSGQCGYIARFVRVTKIYDLDIPASREQGYQSLLDRCRR